MTSRPTGDPLRYFSASGRPPSLEELEQIISEGPTFTRAQAGIKAFNDRVGAFGVIAVFTVVSVLGSELLTLLLDQFLPVDPLSYLLSFVIPLVLTPPLCAFSLHLITGAARVHERNIRIAAGFRALAMSDPLTGVLNRRGLFDWAEKTDTPPVTLTVVDVDRFKQINDAHGHQGGDRALIAVAARLREMSGDGGVVARTGGDEFVIVHCRPVRVRPARATLRTPDGFDVVLSLGWQDYTGDIDATIAGADDGMYVAKLSAPDVGPVTST